ncbi:MAG: Mannose-1-phosphate guanylyltransferase 1 [Anaerolineales bacterium]|nr:Mannose-1-phosphate guanylyltransferase 1 [Anaerolineales bacterium]
MTTYALVLAGGVGSRLWPRSRVDRPKQLQALISDQSMLQETIGRLEPMVLPDHIFIMTNAKYVGAVREQLPSTPPENVIGEPAVRGTASAIGYGALAIAHRDPSAVMFSLHADHYIRDVEGFRQALQAAADVAGEGYLVTLGITPQYPEIGYGYIERAETLGAYAGHTVYRVARFTEKPDQKRAEAFADSGRYYWNSGLFTWQVSTILDAFAAHIPDTYQKLRVMGAAIGTDEESETLAEVWLTLENQTIDYGIMEQAEDVAVVPASFGWSDVGSWDTLYDLRDADSDGNVVAGEHIGVDTRGSFIHTDGRLIATAGVEDLIIVDTGDVVLVCPRGRAQDVKAIVDQLKQAGRTDVL